MAKRKYGFYFFILVLSLISINLKSQNIPTLSSMVGIDTSRNDSIVYTGENNFKVDNADLKRIMDVYTLWERKNNQYAVPRPPRGRLERLLKKDKPEISQEAKYWLSYKKDPSTIFDEYTLFRDTVIVNQLFMPLIFRGREFTKEELTFHSLDSIMKFRQIKPQDVITTSIPALEEYKRRKEIEEGPIHSIEKANPSLFKYTKNDLPKDIVKSKEIKLNIHNNLPLRVEIEPNFSELDAPVKFIPERTYWTSGFESAIQFSQNHVSNNWHRGGSSNLNIFSKNRIRYNYSKDKITLNNELEFSTRVYNAPKDSMHAYRVGEDMLRLRSELGHVAFKRWNYSFITEIRTQIFTNYVENSKTKQAAFLAPISMKFDLGMQYKYNKTYKRHNNIDLVVSPSPLSLTYTYSNITNNITLHNYGFKAKEDGTYKKSFTDVGSSLNARMRYNINRTTSLESRLDYTTTYKRAILELENTLNLRISRFFSTMINVQIRFDDGVTKEKSKSYWQTYELMSFGFNYKW